MSIESFKPIILPIIITALVTALGTVLSIGYAAIRQLDRMSTMLEVHIPVTDRRLKELEKLTKSNEDKNIDQDIRLAVIDSRDEQRN